jgi:hypothetical protein
MNNNDQKPSVERNVMDAIRSGKVHMRPRWKFVLSGALAALGGIILLLTLLYITSFAFFELRQSGALFVPVFGMRGVFAFFAALPVLLIILVLLFIVILEVLVRRYRVGYRTPLLVSVVAVLLVVGIGGWVLERTRIHDELSRQDRAPGGLPAPLSMIYRPDADHVPDIYHGTIISMIPGGFLLADDNGAGTTTVLIDPSTRLPLGADFDPGQEVVVFGDGASGTVRAIGIRQISE